MVAKPATPPKSVKIPKLAKKDKSRLPRKQKKAQQKAAQALARKQAAVWYIGVLTSFAIEEAGGQPAAGCNLPHFANL